MYLSLSLVLSTRLLFCLRKTVETFGSIIYISYQAFERNIIISSVVVLTFPAIGRSRSDVPSAINLYKVFYAVYLFKLRRIINLGYFRERRKSAIKSVNLESSVDVIKEIIVRFTRVYQLEQKN